MKNNNLYELMEDTISFSKEWLQVKDCELRILVLTSILADNSLAFRGTLATMCNWLGIQSCGANNRKIKDALHSLKKKGFLFYKVEGRTYHISISNKGMKQKQIIKIRRAWIDAFKAYNRDENNEKINPDISVDWIKILRVFMWLFSKKTVFTTYAEIADELGISISTVHLAIKAIQACELKGIRLQKDVVKEAHESYGETSFHTLGTKLTVWVRFSEIKE